MPDVLQLNPLFSFARVVQPLEWGDDKLVKSTDNGGDRYLQWAEIGEKVTFMVVQVRLAAGVEDSELGAVMGTSQGDEALDRKVGKAIE